MTPAALFAEIEAASPGFSAVAKEHLRDNGELLPHLLMADLLRYVGAALSVPASESEIRVVLAALDAAALCGNAETENVVALSFCENLELEPFFPRLRPLLGLALLRFSRKRHTVTHAR